ncbi:hypothetical protein XFF6990_320097 [Xanthomonas citri pv. fuscans]|nr:hypothetical protein XFF6990_320097 [Xanthomonas citri pv. fuscans]
MDSRSPRPRQRGGAQAGDEVSLAAASASGTPSLSPAKRDLRTPRYRVAAAAWASTGLCPPACLPPSHGQQPRHRDVIRRR